MEQTLGSEAHLEDLAIDYLPLEDISSPGTLTPVLVASTPRLNITSLSEMVRETGLQPAAVEIDGFSIAAGLIQEGKIGPDETVLVLELGAHKASLSILAKRQMMFCRALPFTGEKLTQAVSDHLRVNWAEAEELKRRHGLTASNEEGENVARALSSSTENLLIDIAHSFKSFSYQTAQSNIRSFEKILLSGGGALLPRLPEFLQERLNAPAEIVDSLKFFPLAPSIEKLAPSASSPRFTLAMSLALREVSLS